MPTNGSIPEHWTWSTIGQACELNPRRDSLNGHEANTSVTFVPMPAVDATSGAISSPQVRPLSVVRKGYTAFKQGDVIMAKITPCMENGKAAIVRELENGLGFGSTEFHVLRPNGVATAEYLYHYIRQQSFRRAAEAEMTGSVGQRRVPADFLRDAPIPIPPIEEQRRIAAKLDDLLGRVAATRERLDRVPAILRRFRRSVLISALSGRLTEDWRANNTTEEPMDVSIARCRERSGVIRTRRGVPQAVDIPSEVDELTIPATWAKASVAELLRSGVLADVKDGNHGTNHPKQGDFVSDGVPFITASQVKDYQIDYEGAPKLAGEALDRIRVGLARPGDAVLTHKGTVGRAAINSEACVLTPQTTYYRCNPEYLDAEYMVFMFTTPQFYNQLASVMSQTTRDFVPISEQFRLFAILPPLAEQRRIAESVAALLKLAGQAEIRYRSAASRAARANESILARAFAGEL